MSVGQLPPLAGALGRLGLVPADPGPRTPAPDASSARRAAAASPAPLLPQDVDWQLVVGLRREAVELISNASAQWQASRNQPMPEEDRRVRGRAIIRSVVHARAQSLGEAGEALWPLELELRYVDAVDNAI